MLEARQPPFLLEQRDLDRGWRDRRAGRLLAGLGLDPYTAAGWRLACACLDADNRTRVKKVQEKRRCSKRACGDKAQLAAKSAKDYNLTVEFSD